MSNIIPTKQHLRENLLFIFNMKKNATEAQKLLAVAYPEYAPDIRLCQRWFARFKNGDFDLDDRERPGPVKKFKDDELEALLNEDPSRSQRELAQSLNVTQAAIWKRLKILGMIRKRTKCNFVLERSGDAINEQ